MTTELSKEKFTSGIINIPLTKPAKVFFISKDLEPCKAFESLNIEFIITYLPQQDKYRISSVFEIEPPKLKEIWENWHLSRPHFESEWRYPMWEIDTKEECIIKYVLQQYRRLEKKLNMMFPVYIHETMKGYHFICLQPISNTDFKEFINSVRETNPKYPPITLRIRPNKYENESVVWLNGNIHYSDNYIGKKHSDTEQFKHWLDNQELERLKRHYWIVNYRLDVPEGDFKE